MLNTPLTPATPMSAKDKSFYQQLGRRIAEARKAAGITQVELAQTLGVAQQTLAHYEGGVSRIAVALLPRVAEALGTSVEELLGQAPKPGKRGPAPKLSRQIQQIQALPRSKQRFVMQMLDAVIQQAGR